MPTAYVTVGAPGAGKSHGIKVLFADRPGIMVVSTDAIRADLNGSAANQHNMAAVWTEAYRQVHAALSTGRNVVIDATAGERDKRQDLSRFCRVFGANAVVAIHFDAPIDVCLERNRWRQRVVPDHVVRRIHAAITDQPPSTSEGFDAVHVIP